MVLVIIVVQMVLRMNVVLGTVQVGEEQIQEQVLELIHQWEQGQEQVEVPRNAGLFLIFGWYVTVYVIMAQHVLLNIWRQLLVAPV